MHYSSLMIVRQLLKQHLLTDAALMSRPLRVLDVGGADVNGSYRTLFERIGANYRAADIALGSGVDVVIAPDGRIDLESNSCDVVVSGQTFEHAWNFWALFAEMVRVCRVDGLIIVIAPSDGSEHRYPVDCYRFLPDSFRALADSNDVDLVECFRSPFGPFFDLVGVFRLGGYRPTGAGFIDDSKSRALDDPVQNAVPEEPQLDHDKMSGGLATGELLSVFHRELSPRNYLEIGVEYGTSLARAECNAIGIDPSPNLRRTLAAHQRVMEMTSEDFFLGHDVTSMLHPLDLVFIDGMHLVEHVITEFMWIEQHAHRGTVVVIDDIFPNHRIQAERLRQSRAWVGDVWKAVDLLRFARSDLLVLTLDTYPTGCAVVIGLDSESTGLWSAYDVWLGDQMRAAEVPERVLRRSGALAPDDPLLDHVLRQVRAAREAESDLNVESLRTLVTNALPRRVAKI